MDREKLVSVNPDAPTTAEVDADLSISDAIDSVCALQIELKRIKARIDAHKAAIKAAMRANKVRKLESDTGHVAQFISRTETKLDKAAVQKILSKRQWNSVTEVATSDTFKVQ